MIRRMSSRGPDAEGIWNGSGVVLGHRRLAIIDLDPRSNQPMPSQDGRFTIVFNGEIYNYEELRNELESQGEVFRTTSDTEVLITLYARQRETMLPKLRGMFAFAIWDAAERELFLARDPYGIKPLYYAQTNSGFAFASQVKAIVESGFASTELESAGLAGFYLWGSVPEPWTIYRGTMALGAGSWMNVREGRAGSPVQWLDIGAAWNIEQKRRSQSEAQQRVREAVADSVRAHLVSDVPVSVFLSGGIDSGVVAGLISEFGAEVEGITIGFHEFVEQQHDEVPLAATLSSHYGLNHHVRRITRSEFEADLPRFFDAMDQPTIDGVNTWFASKAAAERGYKVVLSGIGGDELFYGYSLSREIPRRARMNHAIAALPGMRNILSSMLKALPSDLLHPKAQGIPEFMGSLEGEYFLRRGLFLPQELPRLMGFEQAENGLQRLGGCPPGVTGARAVNGEGAVCMLDSKLYLRNQLLRDSDWASMAHSLELRTPLVDSALLDSVKQIHTTFSRGAGKVLLARSPNRALPDAIMNRPKSGFSVPMTEWLADASIRMERTPNGLLSGRRTPWTRRWASVVIDSFLHNSVSDAMSGAV